LTTDQLQQYVAPTDDNLSAVQNYLKSNGFSDSQISYNVFKNQVTVQSTVGQAAKLFNAQFSNYNFANGAVPRTKQYTVPAEIANAVDFISPLTSFQQVQKVSRDPVRITRDQEEELYKRSVPSAANCNTAGVTPTCLRQYYGTYNYTPTAVNGITDVFIAGFIGQNFSPTDLSTFLKKYRPDAANANVEVINQAGALNIPVSLLSGAEAMLDTETIVSATYPLKATFFNYGNQLTQGDIFELAFTDIMNNYEKYGKPGVYSVSYGADENTITAQEAAALCKTAAALTAMGTTILIASGDNGVGGTDGDTCPPFVPTYPSGCPYVLSVGALQDFSPEVAVNPSLAGFYSGAGYSNLYAQPAYQKSAVAAYGNPAIAGNYYNRSGRAYPDVSAQGSMYVIQFMDLPATVGGTSASTPTWASVIALINDLRRKAGKSNVGFVNAALYKATTGLKDITSGSSLGCKSAPTAGFPVTKGWDPSTGLGSPLFDQLRSVFGV
ncbi:subtilisin-like protein, partial [Meira miltonrushii]